MLITGHPRKPELQCGPRIHAAYENMCVGQGGGVRRQMVVVVVVLMVVVVVVVDAAWHAARLASSRACDRALTTPAQAGPEAPSV